MLPSRRRVLVSDTVGFIRNLPTTLVQAFRATLEEVTEAALVLHVVDGSSPGRRRTHRARASQVLAEIGAAEIPQILVMNKMDRLPEALGDAESLRAPPAGRSGRRRSPWNARAVAVSALTGEGIDRLLALIDGCCRSTRWCAPLSGFLPATAPRSPCLHEFGRVLSTRYQDDSVEVEAEVPESLQPAAPGVILNAPHRLWKTLWERLSSGMLTIVIKGTYHALNHDAAIPPNRLH